MVNFVDDAIVFEVRKIHISLLHSRTEEHSNKAPYGKIQSNISSTVVDASPVVILLVSSNSSYVVIG